MHLLVKTIFNLGFYLTSYDQFCFGRKTTVLAILANYRYFGSLVESRNV